MVTKKSAQKDIEDQATSLWKTPLFKWGLITFLAIAVGFSVWSLFLGDDEAPVAVDEASEVVVPAVEEEVVEEVVVEEVPAVEPDSVEM